MGPSMIGLGVAALVIGCSGAALGFDPISGDEPLPTTVDEAEAHIRETVYFFSQVYPDRVRCAPVHEGGQDLFECRVTKAGSPEQLFFVTKG